MRHWIGNAVVLIIYCIKATLIMFFLTSTLSFADSPNIEIDVAYIDIYENSSSSFSKISNSVLSVARQNVSGLDNRLENILTEISSNEKIPVIIQFNQQIDSDYLTEKYQNYTKFSKKQQFITELKSFSKNSQKNVRAFLELNKSSQKVEEIVTLWINNSIACQASKDVIDYLILNFSEVANIWLDDVKSQPFGKAKTSVEKQTDSIPKNVLWNVSRVKAPDVWGQGYTGDGIVVGLIDTGVNYNHQDLADHMWDGDSTYPNHGYDFIDSDYDPMDEHGNGTHCAGTIAGDGTSGTSTGVAPDASIMAVRAIPGTFAITANAVQFCLDNGADVISMSGGWGYYDNYCNSLSISDNLRLSVRELADIVMSAGIVWVVAAGNDAACSSASAPELINVPADVPSPWYGEGGHSSVIAVGATNSENVIAAFSNYGPVVWDISPDFDDFPGPQGLIKPNITAPGISITSLSYTSNTAYVSNWSGTSMATPHVTGVICLMLQKNPYLSPWDIDRLLCQNALDLGDPGMDNYYGAGLIDALATVTATPTSDENIFTISNVGDADLVINTISSDREWLSLGPAVPPELNIEANQNTTIQCIVDWQGVSTSSEQATLTIYSNDPDEDTVTLMVTAYPYREFTLTISASPTSGGTTVPEAGDHIYSSGKGVDISALPADGYQFTGWTGDVVDSGNPVSVVTINDNKIVIANFEIDSPVDTPTLAPEPGIFEEPLDVSLSCTTEGASIFYTTDGTDPDEIFTLYTSPIHLDVTTEIRARAYKTGQEPSEVASGLLTISSQALSISVTNIGGNPVRAVVEVYSDINDWEDYSNITDTNGELIITSLPAGQYTVLVSSWSDRFLFIKENVTIPGTLDLHVSDLTPVEIYTKAKDGVTPISTHMKFVPFVFSDTNIGVTSSLDGHTTFYVSNWQYSGIAAVCFSQPYNLVELNKNISGPTTTIFNPVEMPTGELQMSLEGFQSITVTTLSDYVNSGWGVPVNDGDNMIFSPGAYKLFPELSKRDSENNVWRYKIAKGTLYDEYIIESGGSYVLQAGGNFLISTDSDKTLYETGELVQITNEVSDSYENILTNIYGYLYDDSSAELQETYENNVSQNNNDTDFLKVTYLQQPDSDLGDRPQYETYIFTGGTGDYYYRDYIDGTSPDAVFAGIVPTITISDPEGTVISQVTSWETYRYHNFILPDPAVNGTYYIVVSLDTGPHNGIVTGQNTFAVGFETVVTPTFDPEPGIYNTPLEIIISCATDDVVIYYTLDGTDPNQSSTIFISPIYIDTSTEIRAIAYKTGSDPSGIAIGNYEIAGWMVGIAATEGTQTFPLQFGVHPLATDGIDTVLGESELPPNPPTGTFDVRFTGTYLGNGTLTDIRFNGTAVVEYLIDVQRASDGDVTFTWDPVSDIDGTFTLQDAFGGILLNVDMTGTTQCTISNSAITQVKIIYSENIWSQSYPSGWSMVSMGLDLDDTAVASVFPTAISVYEFDPDSGYEVRDTLIPGKGYWLNLPGVYSNALFGSGINDITLDLPQGWSMLGTISGQMAVADIIQNPENNIISIYDFDSGYSPVGDYLEQGKGYWIKLAQSGTITLQEQEVALKVLAQESIDQRVQHESFEIPLMFDTSFGQINVSIYVSNRFSDVSRINEYFELPPPAPIQLADARIIQENTNGLRSILISETGDFRADIKLTTPMNEKVSVRWDRSTLESGKYFLSTDSYEVDMALVNTLQIQNTNRLLCFSYRESVTRPITEYSLAANYPNPFNPETTIPYTIKESGLVKLTIYNLLGQEIRTLVNEINQPGKYTIRWDGNNSEGEEVSGGLYLYRLRVNDFIETKKMLFMK